jgi:hypothetical protein
MSDIDSLTSDVGPLGISPTIGGRDGIILNEPEAAWVRACWLAFEGYRRPQA